MSLTPAERTAETPDFRAFIDPLLSDLVARTGLDTGYVNLWHPDGTQESRYVCDVGGSGLRPGMTMPQGESICARCRAAGILWTSDLQGDLPGTMLDGSEFNTYLSIPLHDGAGETIGTLCGLGRARITITDPVLVYVEGLAHSISTYLAAPRPVTTGHALLDALLASTRETVLVFDALDRVTGGTRGRGPLVGLLPPTEAALVASALAVVRATGAAYELDTPALRGRAVPTPDGEVVWVGYAAPLIVAEDSQLAAESRAAATRAKGNFLTAMGHELRTPLNAIIGFAALLSDQAPGVLSPRDRRLADRVHTNGVKLLGMVDDILEFTRLDTGETDLTFAPTDLVGLVHEVVVSALPLVGSEGVALEADLPEGPISPILADHVKLKTVLRHLLSNSLSATTQGRVTVGVRTDTLGRAVALEVRDTGPGIPSDRLAAVLQPFEQAQSGMTRGRGGLGLGLATARALCERMGFGLGIESQSGVGTTVTVRLSRPGA